MQRGCWVWVVDDDIKYLRGSTRWTVNIDVSTDLLTYRRSHNVLHTWKSNLDPMPCNIILCSSTECTINHCQNCHDMKTHLLVFALLAYGKIIHGTIVSTIQSLTLWSVLTFHTPLHVSITLLSICSYSTLEIRFSYRPMKPSCSKHSQRAGSVFVPIVDWHSALKAAGKVDGRTEKRCIWNSWVKLVRSTPPSLGTIWGLWLDRSLRGRTFSQVPMLSTTPLDDKRVSWPRQRLEFPWSGLKSDGTYDNAEL